MLEGKELETKIGEFGAVSFDITDKGMLKISAEIQIDLVAEAKKLAAKTATPIDDAAIAWLEKISGK